MDDLNYGKTQQARELGAKRTNTTCALVFGTEDAESVFEMASTLFPAMEFSISSLCRPVFVFLDP